MVVYEDFSTSVVYRFITNNNEFDALTISELYRILKMELLGRIPCIVIFNEKYWIRNRK